MEVVKSKQNQIFEDSVSDGKGKYGDVFCVFSEGLNQWLTWYKISHYSEEKAIDE